MSLFVIGLVLTAAAFHATWNALLRSTGDRRWGMLVINVACNFISIPIILLMPLPPVAAWPYIFISGVLITGYSIALIKAYEHGELGQVYPVARGIAPLLVTISSMLIAGDHPAPRAILGICLISFGIIALAEFRQHPHRKAFIAAILTGCFIAAYTVTDGMGGRLGADPVTYCGWRSFICSILMYAVYWRVYRTTRFDWRHPETWRAMGAAVIAFFGYAVIIWAMKTNPMGMVSALRETSVVFAVLIGGFFLKERLTPLRLGACVVIAIGAACLSQI